MFSNLYDAHQAQSDCDKERFTLPLKITDENLHASFENFSKDEIVKSLLADKTWFKLSDRGISFEGLEEELSQCGDIILDVIREGTTVAKQLEILAYAAVDSIIEDYEVQNAP